MKYDDVHSCDRSNTPHVFGATGYPSPAVECGCDCDACIVFIAGYKALKAKK